MTQLVPVTDPAEIERIRQLQAGGMNALNVDFRTGGDPRTRALASIKMTPAGRRSFLASVYGEKNVATDSAGNLYYRKADGAWASFEDEGINAADIADWTGDFISMAPPTVTGLLTANPLAVGAAGAGGAALRQGLSASLPGDDQMSMTDRAVDIGTNALFEGGAQLGVNALAKVYDTAIRPRNFVARGVSRALDRPYGQEGAQIEQATGIAMTPGEVTGSQSLKMLENVVRANPWSADRVLAFDQARLGRAAARVTEVMDRLMPAGGSGETVGKAVGDTFRKSVDDALTIRSARGRTDFDRVALLSKGKPVVATENLRAAITELVDDLDVPGAGDMASRTVRALNGMLSELPEKGLTAQQLNRLLQVYGKAASGSGQLFADIDRGQQRMIAARVFGALNRDWDQALAEVGPESEAALVALRAARDNWARNSEPIARMRETVLGRVFNGATEPAPEAVAAKFLTMHPSEIRAIAPVLNSQGPETMQQVGRHMLQSALEAATPAPSSTGAAHFTFSPSKFLSFVNKHAARFNEVLDSTAQRDLQVIGAGLKRIADQAGMQGGSRTAPFLIAWDMLKGAFSLNLMGLGLQGAAVLAPRKMAEIMTTAQGRKALATVVHARTATKGAVAAGLYISALAGRDPGSGQSTGQSVPPVAQTPAE